jgi:hypothetical protein
MINILIRNVNLITVIGKTGVFTGEMFYVLGLVIVVIVLVPCALLLRAVIEIRAATRHGPVIHGYVKPVWQ